jgi:hypothetical protein
MTRVRCTATYCENNEGLFCVKESIQILYYEDLNEWPMTRCNEYKEKLIEQAKESQIQALKEYADKLEADNFNLRNHNQLLQKHAEDVIQCFDKVVAIYYEREKEITEALLKNR